MTQYNTIRVQEHSTWRAFKLLLCMAHIVVSLYGKVYASLITCVADNQIGTLFKTQFLQNALLHSFHLSSVASCLLNHLIFWGTSKTFYIPFFSIHSISSIFCSVFCWGSSESFHDLSILSLSPHSSLTYMCCLDCTPAVGSQLFFFQYEVKLRRLSCKKEKEKKWDQCQSLGFWFWFWGHY